MPFFEEAKKAAVEITVETLTYSGGGREEDQVAFADIGKAHEYAKQVLGTHGSRVWINGIETKKGDLK